MVETNKYVNPPLPIFLILICYLLIVWIFGSVSDWLLFILIIVTAISVFIGYRGYEKFVRDREKPIIKKIIEYLKGQTIHTIYNHKTELESFKFPDSLKYDFSIPFDDKLFRKISRIKRRKLWKIEKINKKFCKKINEKNKKLIDKAEHQEILGYEKSYLVLIGKYKKLNSEEVDKLLQERNLSSDKTEIEELRKKLLSELKKLPEFNELIDRWERKYLII